MPAASSNNLTHVPLPAAPLISTAKSKSKKKSAAASVQPAAKPVESSLQRLTEPWTIAMRPPLSSAMPPLPKSSLQRLTESGKIARRPPLSKSKVRPRPNFAAVETHEPDVTHDLETLDIGTTSQTAKSKKKKSVAVAASMASKKGVSGVKSKRYKTLDSIPVSLQPAKGKEKGAPSKISSSTAAGSSGVRKTKRQSWISSWRATYHELFKRWKAAVLFSRGQDRPTRTRSVEVPICFCARWHQQPSDPSQEWEPQMVLQSSTTERAGSWKGA
ncbi:hypothetical protein JB92DRAFT_2835730 [Gautieria morchelliformis]|nr:hypothetical protein JB92DRAFT_2835730 [Gautieria morchelliformis]